MDIRKTRSSIGLVGVMLLYACMAFPDAIGVVAERLHLENFASSLVFVWFALLSLPAGMLCERFGACAVASAALIASLPALALMALGAEASIAAAAGLAMIGAANVVLQVALPTCVAGLFGTKRQASVMTAGLFAKTLFAMLLPWAIALFGAIGEWRILFPSVGVVFGLSAFALVRGKRDAIPSRHVSDLHSVVEVAKGRTY